MISRNLGKASHWLHKKYIKGIEIGLKKAYPSKYDKDKDGEVDGDMAEKLKTDATKAYAGILIATAIATGIGAATAASSVVAALKSAEVVVVSPSWSVEVISPRKSSSPALLILISLDTFE